ncbi:arabinan endo-1,5-alpha-L-arabinosidase [Mucilaginibacter sp. OK283]|uniref:arabinan endo-1,5-alpha-L-arabinosidase n=1 Tax=Mucilaginibacter sp. OK283 TaxID=1881049 RepID=UPI0008C74467|nr:arabinan endo-1,5-alpha-L-arabinosidase [Mucilaginibacter sp. OK283]SEO22157.1 arabinan endo-1,5-alpha-L-arabinosidase [Mucilaginibacter sp. OK283]
MMKKAKYLLAITGLATVMISCSKKDTPTPTKTDTTTTPVTPAAFNINSITDTYADISAFTYYPKWTVYNVHDPSIKKFGDYYYCYSTDVGFGIDVRSGLQIRRSKDLVQWEYVGWVFSSLPAQGSAYITGKGGTPFNSLWAPYVMKVGSEYRLYYSLSSAVARLSVIGMATATSPEGPWTEKGVVVTSANDASIQTNAIDPTVVTTTAGEQYMYYGSAWDGIYILKLDASTGLAASPGDKGKRIANRGFTGGKYNGNIEGAEVIYNPDLKKYFLFISYDWLQTKYNVRVGRGDSPTGPFYDYNGQDINTNVDHGPMILAPYQFNGHGGWQGTGHCAVFDDGSGQYFMAHQGRPGVNSYFMDLHVRKISWTPDGWPVVSPERYANVAQTAIANADVVGTYEKITLGYHIVPGYGTEQTNPDFQVATTFKLDAAGTIDGSATDTWTYASPYITLKYAAGATYKLKVERERDWENKVASTLIFTGLDNIGTAVWGKKR